MVGAALCAEGTGPSGVFVGIQAPTQRTWDGDSNSVKLYGKADGLRFIDDNTRQAIAAALGLKTPAYPWWVGWENLRDIDGQDISDWRTIETIKRLHARSDELARQIVDKIEWYVLKLDATVS
jgi:hypothetical protein